MREIDLAGPPGGRTLWHDHHEVEVDNWHQEV
jgi:hypothetical protein